VTLAYCLGKVGPVPELKRLHADHAPAVLAFELANRAYFAASISDRGDDFFAQFTDRYNALLAEQEAGISACYVLVAEDGSVLGRFNLVDIEDHTAELGYRVAQHVAGRGVATATVRELCRLAAARHGLRTLRNSATGSRSMWPAVAWRPRPSGSCAGWRRPATGCAHCGRPPPARMSRPRRY